MITALPQILLACLLGIAPQDVLHMNDGTKQACQLVSIDEQVAIQVEGQTRNVSPSDIADIQFGDQPSNRVQGEIKVELVDRSVLWIDSMTLAEDGIVTCSEPGEQGIDFAVPSRNVRSIQFQSHNGQLAEQWAALVDSDERTSDWLVFNREEVLDFVEGKVQQVTDEVVRFSTGEQTADANRERVEGLLFFHPSGRQLLPPTAMVVTNHGSQLLIRNLASGADETYTAQAVCGSEITLQNSQIRSVDFASIRFKYLSDIPPSTVDWQPLIYNRHLYEYQLEMNRPRMDQSFSAQPLTLNFGEWDQVDSVEQVEYEKGFSAKGGTRIVFPLQGSYRKLVGYVGLAPSTLAAAEAEVQIIGDGKPLANVPLKMQGHKPVKLDIDVSTVQRLTIRVDYYDGQNVGDLVHFCDLKVIR